MTSALALTAGSFVTLAGLATPAHAATIASSGPLTNVTVSTDLNCSVNHVADAAGEFYGGTACGTFVAVGATPATSTLYGPASVPAGGSAAPRTAFTAVSQSAVSGTGTALSPYQVTTVVDAGPSIRVTEVDKYVLGDEFYTTSVTLTNKTAAAVTAILYRAGDCYLGSSDIGYGRVSGTSIACTADTNPSGRVEKWIPLTAGSHYMEDDYNTVWARIGSRTDFPDTCACTSFIDNGAGLSWQVSLPASGSATFSHQTDFGGNRALTTSKTASPSTVPAGGTTTYSITIHNPNVTAVTVNGVYDDLPAGWSYVSGTTSGITTANPAITGSHLAWTVSYAVPAGGNATLNFRARAPLTAGTYVNTAGGSSPTASVTPVIGTAPVTVARTQSIVHAEPAIVLVEGNPKDPATMYSRLYLFDLTARLTDYAGVALPGRTLTFTADSGYVCSGTTDGSGYAHCSGAVNGDLAVVLALGYDATFAGDATYYPSSDHGPLARALSTDLP